jgi:two-component system sensor histidine kinase ChiS
LRNLFVNAIKFSSDNSKIFAKLIVSETTYDDGNKIDAIHFSITDQAIGVPEEELDSIFLPFTQSSRSKTNAGGTGLGLAISKEVILAHHGKIWARNNQDIGATFEFILPVLQAKQMDGHKIIAENDIGLARQTSCNKAANILIVDDEEACLLSMELLLHDTGYKLIKASGGCAALDYLKRHPDTIDIIMLDLMMPDMYGLNLLAELKKDQLLCKIPVILQSGISDVAEIERAHKMGIACYIKKPYQKYDVLVELERLLN